MNAVTKPQAVTQLNTAEVLSVWYLICDGDSYNGTLDRDFSGKAALSEALIPSIRKVACMIAASRHDFTQRSPSQFTEEADWFAARILVLQARSFHLDVSLLDMLALANSRAKNFAKKHGLDFTPATVHLSLHAGRPEAMLIMETPFGAEQEVACEGLVANSQKINQQVYGFNFA